ncbi:hypothetical protein L1857_26225 [Amycolatopsis thermalba]|uniref:Uncharacterized protein n=1 Tax=Amycolatopsis thermalba TaxID=944492 RepID=A0ABY4P121_9PSEU|nr:MULTISPECIES: hypothetical protein [Amycolatopsis]UQS26060.1 hypothetical protein L1857_26225 [Amycolatopsis thermalba]
MLEFVNDKVQGMFFGKMYTLEVCDKVHTVVAHILIPVAPLSYVHRESIDYAFLAINTMIAQSEGLVTELVDGYGGQHFAFTSFAADLLAMCS